MESRLSPRYREKHTAVVSTLASSSDTTARINKLVREDSRYVHDVCSYTSTYIQVICINIFNIIHAPISWVYVYVTTSTV